MSALPDKPQITNYEVTEALKVAHGLRMGILDDRQAGVNRPVREMEMLQVLEAAFGARHDRYNGAIRREAEGLARSVELMRIQLQKYQKEKETVLWALRVQERLGRLLEAIKDSRALRISDEFHALESLLGVEQYSKADAAWDLDR